MCICPSICSSESPWYCMMHSLVQKVYNIPGNKAILLRHYFAADKIILLIKTSWEQMMRWETTKKMNMGVEMWIIVNTRWVKLLQYSLLMYDGKSSTLCSEGSHKQTVLLFHSFSHTLSVVESVACNEMSDGDRWMANCGCGRKMVENTSRFCCSAVKHLLEYVYCRWSVKWKHLQRAKINLKSQSAHLS